MTTDELVETVGAAGNSVWKCYRTFLIVYGSIAGIMTITRLIYALSGIDYDPMDEFWNALVKKVGKKGIPKEEMPIKIKIISKRKV